MHEHVVKFPYARSSGEPKHTTANFFSLFLHLSAVPRIQLKENSLTFAIFSESE